MTKPLESWLEYILGLHTSRIDLGLERIKAIAEEQCLSQFSCPVITVAGTNGKGSCVRFLERTYSLAGYRVGAYYSPHILRFNERIRLQECDVDDETLVKAFEHIEAARQNRPLSFFEFTTLAALWIFQQAELDVLILEVGLGGRLDAVNIVDPAVAIVSSISMDHMDWLGDCLEKIGAEKAGIFRRGKPAICGDPLPPRSIAKYAEAINATLYCINKDFHYSQQGTSWHWQGQEDRYDGLPLPVLKCQNVASSLMAIECLKERLPVTKESVKEALVSSSLSGRFQQHTTPINIIFDVAHNPESAYWLAEQITQKIPLSIRKHAVVGMLKDKDIEGTLAPMIPVIDDWFVSRLTSSDRACDPAKIKEYLTALGVKNCYTFASVAEALEGARKACINAEDRVIVFGSFHTVAEAQKAFNEEVQRCKQKASNELLVC